MRLKDVAWHVFQAGLIGALTLVMMFHWSTEARASPDAIVATSSTAAPAENVLFVERVPSGQWMPTGKHRITHYCSGSCCNGRNAGRTASGAPMTVGRTVAASAKEFPFGTRLLINGNIYAVEDRGVGYGQIDILTGSHREALRKGLYYTEVFVWKEER